MRKKRLAITLGDPGGIGPEITVKALDAYSPKDSTIILFGAKAVFDHPILSPYKSRLHDCSDPSSVIDQNQVWNFVDVAPLAYPFDIGKATATNGKVALEAVCKAVEWIQHGAAHLLVTAPISKVSWHLTNAGVSGHTTLLSQLTHNCKTTMGFYTPKLKTVLATIHVPYLRVPDMLTESQLEQTLDHALLFCRYLGIQEPKIALAGLNPHAGEEGLFGDEEQHILIPFVEKMISKKKTIYGPFSADTLYLRAVQKEFDMVISLYHDQALIPIKLNGPKDTVNVTLGLPFLRTSPAHGTAFDIAYQNVASSASMASAIDVVLNQLNPHGT